MLLALLAALAAWPQEPDAATQAVLRGRFLLPDRSPAAGVALELLGWQANAERVARHGLPGPMQRHEVATDAAGRFELAFEAPGAFQFALRAHLAGHGSLSWRWSEIVPGTRLDLGDVPLQREAVVEGRVVDAQGEPLGSGCIVLAECAAVAPGPGGDTIGVPVEADPRSGAFRAAGLPPGAVRLRARTERTGWIDGPRLELRAGETAAAEIVYAGPAPGRRIALRVRSRPFHVVRPARSAVTLVGADGSVRAATFLEGSAGGFAFDGLEPGRYRLRIDDPRFAPWEQEVEPGQSVVAALEGSCAVRLALEDEAGRAVEVRRVLVRLHLENVAPTVFELLAAGSEAPPDGVLRGILPMEQTWTVAAAGFAPAQAVLDDLAPGEVRELRLRVARGATVRGVVLHNGGVEPRAGARVSLEPAEGSPGGQFLAREAIAGADGSFDFAAVPPGRYRLLAIASPLLRISSGELEVQADTAVQLVLPATGSLAGTLSLPPGTDLTGLRLRAYPLSLREVELFEPGWRDLEALPSVAPQADGRFAIEELPAGVVVVEAFLPRTEQLQHHAPALELGTVAIAPGTPTETTFDLSERAPGTLGLRVSLVGDGPRRLSVHAQAVDAQGAPLLRPVGPRQRAPCIASAELGEDGAGELRPLFGGLWRIEVAPPEGGWSLRHPDLVRVPPGGRGEVRVQVTLHEGTLHVLDEADGAPLADRILRVTGEGGGRTLQVRSDASGRITARLPAGSYRVRDGGDGTRPFAPTGGAAPVEWSAAGASPASVSVRRAAPLPHPFDR